MKLSICSVDYSLEGEEDNKFPILHLFCRSTDNKRHIVHIKDFKPYFYISTNDFKIIEDQLSFQDIDSDYISVLGEPLIKITMDIPPHVGSLRRTLEHKFDILTYEADVLFPLRYLIDKNIYTGIEYEPIKKEIKRPIDMESNFRWMAIDIETYAIQEEDLENIKAPIIVYGIYDSYDDTIYIFTTKDIKKDLLEKKKLEDTKLELVVCKNEQRLLYKIKELLIRKEPDIIFSFFPFDMRYTIDRLEEKGMKYKDISPINVVSRRGGSVKVSGIQILDIAEMYGAMLKKSKWMSLEAIAEQELDLKALHHEKEVYEMWNKNPIEVLERNLRDVELVKMLIEELQMLTYFDSIRRVVGCNLRDTLIRSRIQDILDLRMARKYNVVLPSRRYHYHADYTGAKVFRCLKGFYTNVLVVDFSGMYPSLIKALNIGYTTDLKIIGRKKKGLGGMEYIDRIEELKDLKDRWNVEELPSFTVKELEQLEPIRMPHKEKAKELPGDSKEYRIEKAISDGLKSVINCFTPDTEVLTPKGLKQIKDFEEGDLVLTLNPETGEVEKTKVIMTQEFGFEGNLIKIESNNIDFLVTPNHRFYGSKEYAHKRYPPKWWKAKEIKNLYSFRLPRKREFNILNNKRKIDLAELSVCSYRTRGDQIKFDSKQSKWFPRFFNKEEFVKFLAWYVSEGHVYISKRKEYPNGNIRGVNYKIGIAQHRMKYRKRIKKILERLNVDFSVSENGFSVSNRVLGSFLIEKFGRISSEKKLDPLIFSLSTNLRRIFLEELLMGDGRKNGLTYRTSSKELANDLIYLGESLGISTTHTLDKEDCYTVNFNRRNGIHHLLKKSRHFSEVNYKGKVYCVTAEKNHIILAGRNKKLQWTGQSLYGKFGYSGNWNKYRPASRFYEPRIAALVTKAGRLCQEEIYSYLEEEGWKVLYGDTDSLFIKLQTDNIKEESEKIINLLNNHMRKYLNEELGAERITLTLGIDKIFTSLVLLTKKRYGGKKIDGSYEWKGLEMIKRDQATVTKEIQEELLKKALNGYSKTEIEEYFNEFNNNFSNRSIEDIAETVRLTKNPEKYKSPSYHLKGYMYSKEVLDIDLPSPGNRFYLVYIKELPEHYPQTHTIKIKADKKTKEKTDKDTQIVTYVPNTIAFNTVEEIPEDIEIDYRKMKEKTVLKKSEDILELLGINIEKVIKEMKGYVPLTKFRGR